MSAPTYLELGALLGRDVAQEQGNAVLQVVTALAKSHTRGIGFDSDGVPVYDIAAAILTCAARLISHPRQVGIDETKGPESARWLATPVAFSLGELTALNRYRVTAL